MQALFQRLVLCAAVFALPLGSGATSVTIVVTNLPSTGVTAGGQALALVGTINGWNNAGNIATVQQHAVSFTLPDLGSPMALGAEWGDLKGGENMAFQLVQPGTWSGVVKADFTSNQGNFRLALQDGLANTVEINAGPVPGLIDQDTAVAVNGARAVVKNLVDPTRFAYPRGRWKALIMSYDDGHEQDRGLSPILRNHGIRGTFHINSGWFDTSTFITSAEVPSLYAGHEISNHTVDHPDLTQVSDGTVQWEIGHCRYILGGLAGYEVDGMSYPLGGYNRRVMDLAAGEGVVCSRTVQAADSLDYFPPNYLKWHPTCHHADAASFADELLNRNGGNLSMLFIWGHSYELDYGYSNNSWAYMDALCSKLGDRGDIWYIGMTEMLDYLSAVQGVTFTSNIVYNPSDHVGVWTKLDDVVKEVRPGRKLAFPSGRTTVRPSMLYESGAATFAYAPGANGLAGSTGLWLHIGHDGWQETRDIGMTNDDAGSWSCAYAISNGARQLNWVVLNDDGVMDDGLGNDWSVPVRALATSVPARVQFVPGNPIVHDKVGAGQNGPGDVFDLNTAGGSLATSNQGGFGSFGQIYLNYDDTNLYVGGVGAQLGGSNNAMAMFLSIDTLPDGVGNLWNIRGSPFGLGFLHNLAFSPAANIAIVLGDEFGDGTFPRFNLGNGYDFGQGIYHLSTNTAYFVPVRGARLAQFDGSDSVPTSSADDDGNRLTDRWKAAIPWESLNAPLRVRSVGALHISGVIASDGVSGADRYLSANYLGASASGTTDGYGNYGFNFVRLYGERVGLPDDDSDRDGIPDGWQVAHFQHPLGTSNDQSRASDDADGDGQSNQYEYLAGTDPTNAASVFAIRRVAGGGAAAWFGFEPVEGRQYRVQCATNLLAVDPWVECSEVPSSGGGMAEIALPADRAAICCRVVVLPQ